MEYVIVYLLIINIIAFFLMAIDKRKAVYKKKRIPEKTLFIIAAIGGSVGSIAGMQFFRHKTKHRTFVFGMPAILVVQLAIAVLFVFYF